jgi:hypothetical protein
LAMNDLDDSLEEPAPCSFFVHPAGHGRCLAARSMLSKSNLLGTGRGAGTARTDAVHLRGPGPRSSWSKRGAATRAACRAMCERGARQCSTAWSPLTDAVSLGSSSPVTQGRSADPRTTIGRILGRPASQPPSVRAKD